MNKRGQKHEEKTIEGELRKERKEQLSLQGVLKTLEKNQTNNDKESPLQPSLFI